MATIENDADTYRAKSYDIPTIESKFTDGYQSIFSSQCIKYRIENCKFLNSIRQHCLDAGYVLNIVCNLDKLPKMLTMFNANGINKCLRTEFMEKFFNDLDKWTHPLLPNRDILINKRKEAFDALSASNTTDEERRIIECSRNDYLSAKPIASETEKRGQDNTILNPMEFLGDDNPLLFLVFEEAFKRSGLITEEPIAAEEEEKMPSSSYELFQR